MSVKKLKPEIFRDAAQLMEDYEYTYACHAIRHAATLWWFSTPYEEYFAKWFKPEGKIRDEEQHGWFGKGTVEKNRQKRILALILCADILERQNKKK